jgi:hypothetical protein
MKDFIPFEEALELKQLEFNEPCFMIYYNATHELRGEGHFLFGRDTKAPTFSQAFRFFRDKYRLCGYVEGMYPWCRYYINSNNDRWEGHKERTYEEAELECIRKLIEIVKQKR